MKTTSLLFLIARMAAMKNVLSPISDTRITVMEEAAKIKQINFFLNSKSSEN